MVPQERQPGCRSVPGILRLGHVLADRVVAGRIEAEQTEGIPDAFSAPERILAAELADQSLHVLWDRRPSQVASRLPAPVEPECSGVPFLDCSRLHEMRVRCPTVPELGENHPEQPEGLAESWPRILALSDAKRACRQLAFSGEQARRNFGSWPQKCPQERRKVPDEFPDNRNSVEHVPQQVANRAHSQPKYRVMSTQSRHVQVLAVERRRNFSGAQVVDQLMFISGTLC